MTLRIEAAGRSHVGLVRRRNEDASYVGRSILAVADGLGGHPAGDVASTTVIDVLRAYDHVVPPADLRHLGSCLDLQANVAFARRSRPIRSWGDRPVERHGHTP